MIKRVTITLAFLGTLIFVSLSNSIRPQPESTAGFTQAKGMVNEGINTGSVDSMPSKVDGDNGLNPELSTISSQDRARMLAGAVEFRYDFCTGYNAMQAGLGTKLDEHTILTHNHYGNQANFCMIDPGDSDNPQDIAIKTASLAMGHGDGYGDQTQLVHTAEAIEDPFAPIATQQVIRELVSGDFVEVIYRDDSSSRLAIASLQIRGFLENSVVVLEDSENIINVGDSGGGVYYQGALIGNTWRYLLTLDQDDNIIDKVVHVHLLPLEFSPGMSVIDLP
jgi:hypothetical protein